MKALRFVRLAQDGTSSPFFPPSAPSLQAPSKAFPSSSIRPAREEREGRDPAPQRQKEPLILTQLYINCETRRTGKGMSHRSGRLRFSRRVPENRIKAEGSFAAGPFNEEKEGKGKPNLISWDCFSFCFRFCLILLGRKKYSIESGRSGSIRGNWYSLSLLVCSPSSGRSRGSALFFCCSCSGTLGVRSLFRSQSFSFGGNAVES